MRQTAPLVLGLCLAAAPASATLLSYDGFAGADYAAGSIDGQAYAGTGYAAGNWDSNADNLFAAGGLTYTTLQTTPGYRVLRHHEETIGNLDTSVGGVFDNAGLVGTTNVGGNDYRAIGGPGVSATVYYSFLGRPATDNIVGWSGFNLFFANFNELLGIGDTGGSVPGDGINAPDDNHDFYALFGLETVMNGGLDETPIGSPRTTIDRMTHLFVVKAEYVEDDVSGNVNVTYTVWLDPDPTLSEGAQLAGISTSGIVGNDNDQAGFDNYRMRGAYNEPWEFDEVRFGTTFDSVTPVALVPETDVLTMTRRALTSVYRAWR